jgi:hypothetical protein
LSVGTGIGVATGVAAGACSALEAAKDQGLVTDEQFEQVSAVPPPRSPVTSSFRPRPSWPARRPSARR